MIIHQHLQTSFINIVRSGGPLPSGWTYQFLQQYYLVPPLPTLSFSLWHADEHESVQHYEKPLMRQSDP